MEPWTPHALKYRKTGDGPNEGDGDGPNQGDGPDPPKACIICGVYECFAGKTDESCSKRGGVCQFVPCGQTGDDDAQQGKQKGKDNSGEQKGKGKSRLPSWMHDKRYSYDITEADVWTSGDSFETGQGKGNSKSGDSFEETGTGKGKSGDSLTGKGKSGDSLTGKGKSKSGDAWDVDEDNPCSQCPTHSLPSDWQSAFEEAYAQQEDERPARPLRRWASGVLRSPPSHTVPDSQEDPLEMPDSQTNPNEVPGPQENPPAEGNPYED